MTAALALLAAAPSWTLAVGGDVMLNSVTPSAKTFGGVAGLFRSADVAYANLEIPLTRSGKATPRKSAAARAARTQFVLRADPGHARWLDDAGFDALSLGNNHAMDYGPAGLAETTGLLDKLGVVWFGAGRDRAQAERVAVVKAKGLRIGFVSFLGFMGDGALNACWPAADRAPGIAVLRFGGTVDARARARLKAHVEAARKSCDVLVVAMHWGDEKATRPKDYQVRLGRAWIDAGADLVVGAHPHVLQGKELYRGKPILYSAGNLVSPRPGSTAVYRLRFEGRTLKGWEARPARISGGRVSLLTGGAVSAEKRRIAALDRLVAR
jgi:poly-gamma-glutamate capsule biosynthesis protein CapA/YwtB (metallophosphatase superfamily)